MDLQRAGRIVRGGRPTGVEVCHAMVRGPWPATSSPGTTSVGTLAIERRLRPVRHQSFPNPLLPEELRTDNPPGIPRLVDGLPEPRPEHPVGDGLAHTGFTSPKGIARVPWRPQIACFPAESKQPAAPDGTPPSPRAYGAS
ncbi:hypothetical protein ACIF9R_15470 [Streptomyces sp. NPDC086080]|uniref:hypothetical protein n=1 Tax=Streptomyces sp. NPDC086080 TaxID=3365748 RepID=UPI0037D2B1CF